MNQNQKNNLIHLGNIVNTHGLKGELRILTSSSDPEDRFKIGNIVFYDNGGDLIEMTIASKRFHKNFVLITVEGFNDINEVEFLKGKKLFIKRTKDDELMTDLIGYELIDKELGLIGKVESFLSHGVYESFISTYNDKTFNIPYINKFVKNIDDDKKIIKVEIPKEFIE